MPKARVSLMDPEGMALRAVAESGFQVVMDAGPDVGGKGQGLRPTELTAISLAGCTGIDVLSILKKMRVTITRFDIDVTADRREEHPRVFSHINLVYTLDSPDVKPEQFARAVSLSAERYCSVSAMLEKTAAIRRVLILNGTELEPA